MSDNVLITPGSRKIEFKDSSANVDAKIETDSSGNLIITNPGGDISIGDTTADIFVGDGTNNIDIVFEQDGEIRGTTGVTVTLGQSDSNVRMATDLNLNSNDITNVNDLTVAGNLTVSGTTTTLNSTNSTIADRLIELGNGTTGTPANDMGLVFERGSSDNVFIGWDESNDRVAVGTGSFTGASSGDLSFTRAAFAAGAGDFSSISSSGNITGSGAVSAEDNIYLTDAGTVRGKLLLNASDRDNVELRAESLGSTMKFFTVGTQALLLDASQNATFAGTISSGAITSSTIQVQHSGTNNISLSPTSTGGVINARNSSGTSVVVMDGRGTPFIDVTGNLKTGGNTRIDSSGNLTNIGTISSGDITTTGIQMGTGTSNDIQADGKTAYIGSAIFGNSASTNVPATAVHIKGSGTPTLRIEDLDSTNQVYDFISNQGVGLSIVDQTSSITPLAFAHTTGNATFAGTINSGAITASANSSVTGTITASGTRPIVITPSSGLITTKGSAGGWAFGYHALGNSNTDHGGFGFLGNADSFSYYYIGASYNDSSVFKFYKTGALAVGSNQILDASRNLSNIGTINSGAITSSGNLTLNSANYIQTSSDNIVHKITGTNTGYTAIGIANTSTGDAGIFMDASNGDFSGSDYIFIGQKNNLDLEIRNNPNGGDIYLSESNVTSLRLSGGNATFAGTISSGAIDSLTSSADIPTGSTANLYLVDTRSLAANTGGSIVFSSYYTGTSAVSGGSYIKGYKENANDGDYGYGLKFGIRQNGQGSTGPVFTLNSSGNATFTGTISSGAITSSGRIKTTGEIEVASSQPRIHLDRGDGSYSWNIYNGDGTGNFALSTFNIANNSGTAVLTLLDNGNATFAGTINSGAITTTGGLTIDVDNVANGALRIEANQTNPDNDFYFAQEIISTLSGTTATTADREQGGIYMDINSTATGGDTSNEHRAYGMYIDIDSTGDADLVYGIYSNATATPTTGTTTNVYGGYFHAEDNGGAGNVGTILGVQGTAVSDNSDSDTNAMYGGYFKAYNVADSATITAATAVYGELEIPSGSADIYGTSYVFRAEYDNNGTVAQTNTTYLYYGNYAGVQPTNAYGVYIVDAVDNYFAGAISSGAITSSGTITASNVNTGQGATEVHLMNQNVRTTDSPTFDELTVTDFVKASGGNLKFSAGGTHVLNIDLNNHVYPQTHNVTDVGFSTSLAFKDAFFSGTGNFGTINTGQGATEVYLMNQNVRTTDSVTFNSVITGSNASGTNVRIGDDAWIGDVNAANTISVRGNQNAANGYIIFGNANTTALGRAGSGQLTYGGDEIYHEGHKPTYSELGTMAYSNLTGTPTIPTNNNQLTNGASYITASNSAITNKLPLAGGTITGDLTVNGTYTADTSQQKVKYSVWTGSTYGIGMHNAITYGGLNDYAMTFQMNSESDRGFWWGDSSHSLAQGAMALTTDGNLTVANGIRIGYGETDTTTPSIELEVAGKAGFVAGGNSNRGNIIMGATGSGTSKWSSLAGTHYNDATGSGNGSGAAGCMIIGNYSDSTNNKVYIGGGPYELNPATEIRFHTHNATTHNLGGSQAMMIDTNGNLILNNDLSIDEYVYHAGDTNTYIRVQADSWTFRTGGGDRFILNNTLNYSQVPLEIKCEGGNTATDGGRFLSVAYSGSNRIATMSSQYSSGNLCIGNGLAYDQAQTGFVSTFANFSRARSGVIVNGGSVQMVGTSGAQQTTVDSAVTAPVRHTFDTTNGNYTATGDVVAYSDKRLKDDVKVIDNAIEKIQQIRGVTFTRNDLEEDKRHAGVIAQEVEKVLPEVVRQDEDTDIKTVAYGNMVGLLIEAIKEQQETIEKLTSRINDIEKGE